MTGRRASIGQGVAVRRDPDEDGFYGTASSIPELGQILNRGPRQNISFLHTYTHHCRRLFEMRRSVR